MSNPFIIQLVENISILLTFCVLYYYLQSGNTPAIMYQNLWQTIKIANIWSGEMQNKKKDGDLFWERTTIAAIKDDKYLISKHIAIK
jgi:hypothetical protein